MTKTYTYMTGVIIALLMCSYVLTVVPASAHEGEVHDDEHTEVTVHMSTPEMEQMIKVLQQLVALLTEYKAQYGSYVVAAPTPVTPTHHDEEDEHEEESEDEHHDGHEAQATTPAKLVIEVESHSGKTHVHVRYTDKPEEMFFVDTALSNESGVIADIASRTSLSSDVIKAALKYTGMNN